MASISNLMIFIMVMAMPRGYELNKPSRSSPAPSILPTASISAIPQLNRVTLPGQITFGGLFSTHDLYDPHRRLCSNVNWEQLVNLQGMIYAIEKINNNASLLPNITVGYDIRNTCNNPDLSVLQTLDLLFQFRKNDMCQIQQRLPCKNKCNVVSQQSHSIPQTRVDDQLVGIIGAKSNGDSRTAQTILKGFQMPQISYAASDVKLNSRSRYPTFFRTVPVNTHLAKIIVAVIARMNWNFISIVSMKTEFSGSIHREVMDSLRKYKVCVDENILVSENAKNLNSIAKNIKGSMAPVVIILLEEHVVPLLLQAFQRNNVTGKNLFTSSDWDPKILGYDPNVIGGMIGISVRKPPSLQFQKYLTEISICTTLKPVLLQYWLIFHEVHNITVENAQQICQDFVTANPTSDFTFHLKRLSYNAVYVIDAVYALAHALHLTLKCNQFRCQRQLFHPDVQLSQIVENLYKINFRGMSVKDFAFNKHGNPREAIYNIVNLRRNEREGRLRPLPIGNWTMGKVEILHLDQDKVKFGPYSNITQLPQYCSPECQAGSYYKYVNKRTCCWTCHECPRNTYSNQTQVSACTTCPLGSVINVNRTDCELIKPYSLNYSDLQNVLMLVTFSISVTFTLITWIIIIRYRNTPVVKGSDFILSQMLLLAILLCLSVAPLFASPVTAFNCTISLFIYCLSISFVMSIILVKTNRISKVFESTFVKSWKSKIFLGNRGPAMLAILLTLIEGVICGLTSIMDPITITRQVMSENTVYLLCRSKTRIGYTVAVGYFAVLGILCAYFAFKTRKLPENFCEAKYISFTSIIMILAIATMVPAYFGTVGPFQAAISSFGIITFATSVLCCMFGHKLYIILIRPELNTRENVMLDIAAYSLNGSSGGNSATNTLATPNRVHVGSLDKDMVIRRSLAGLSRSESMELSSSYLNEAFKEIKRQSTTIPESTIFNTSTEKP